MKKEQTIKEHLDEIRKRVCYVFFPAIAMFFIYFSISSSIITKFLNFYNIQAFVLSPLEYINTQINLSLVLTIVSSIPIILTQLYLFVKPAMKKEHRNKIVKQIAYSSVLAVMGVAFGIFIFANYTFEFLNSYPGLQSFWGVGSVFNYIFFSALSFGIIFQIIIIIPFLDMTNLLKVELLKNKRRFIFFGILILSAWITPTLDIFTMCVMAIPTYATFELGLLLTKFNRRYKNGIWNN